MNKPLKTILSLIFFLTIPFLSTAQDSLAKKATSYSNGMGYFSVGVAGANLAKLNGMLDQYGYAKFIPAFVTIGGGGFGINNRMIIGGEGHGYLHQEEARKGHKSSINGGYGTFDIGYLLVNKSGMRFYPMFGFGGAVINLKIDTLINPTMNKVLAKPSTGTKLEHAAYMLDFSLNLQMRLQRSFFNYVVLKGGYKYADSKNWRLNDQKLTDGPRVGLSGGYFQLQLGF